MVNNSKTLECKDVGCTLPGFWYESLPSGQRVICFRAKHHGHWHTVKRLLPEGVKELQPVK